MAVNDRYNRQELISGWNQERLNASRTVVFGSGNLANYTLVSLAALGIGNVEIYDTAKVNLDREFLLFQAGEGEYKAKALERMLKQINPVSRIRGVSTPMSAPLLTIIGKPDVIIDTTNSQKSKNDILKYAMSRGVRVISASSDRDKAEMYFIDSSTEQKDVSLSAYEGKSQGATTSGIMGGIITEELRKAVMPFNASDQPVRKIAYSLASPRRFSAEDGKLERENLKDKKVLVVGAGALGNFAVLGAALEGIGNIDVLDFDDIDSTNLNRQILFYDAVGKMKATALAERVAEIAPRAKIMGLVEKLDENTKYFQENHPDAILDCVDSFAVRAIINYFAVKNGIPLISGGTDPRSGQVVVYEPGKSACLDCKLEVETALAEQRKAAGCRYAPDPSVIMTNQIVGNMMVGETLKVLNTGYGEPIRRILKYDSTVPVRGGLVGSDEACECSKPEVEEWLKQVDKKARGIKHRKH
ncbi:ThiF family adenylyltransferase [Candidatus Pacearchaeota archaeon]|nr:ThiF family adenylyltransferase [Candidatus Pacearchaeota archaeon]